MNLKLYNYIIKIETLFIMLLKNLSLPKGLYVNNDENEKSTDIPTTSSMTFKVIDNFVFDGKLSKINNTRRNHKKIKKSKNKTRKN